MFTYEIFTNSSGTCLYRYSETGMKSTIPMNEADSDYAEYLRYTEWVEAGNTPEDFWTQTEELTEPKEEI